ncbi:RHS repeat-associated core domain-containing protein [Pseudomonas citri]|uniref:RHS repeat-associated core domain-containing protein n=1 Tax=Pseudomonas citri TaxID=2978349 RepID=UPI0021B56E55|nr:RHS repeat-associated core domain-containing protein [Pseudomonas citri]
MTSTRTLLSRYRYDPLDRVVSCTPTNLTSHQRFYLKSRLATEVQGAAQRSIFQHEDQLLAVQQRQDNVIETTLLATDHQHSVLQALNATQPHPFVYTPYGYRAPENGLLSLLGFNGERPDPITGHYLLGNGYRAFNPVLMRFNSPDSQSPFGAGGLNSYTYCLGDPINQIDPTGGISFSLLGSTLHRLFRSYIDKLFGITRKTIKNYRTIAKGVAIFEDTQKSNLSRLNVVAHGGQPIEGKFPYIIADDRLITPSQLHFRLKNRVNLGKYDTIRTLVCYSADGEIPFGSTLSELTGKPVKAFSGRVLSGPTQTPKNNLPNGTIDNTVSEYMVVKDRYLSRLLFNYRPEKFINIRKAP